MDNSSRPSRVAQHLLVNITLEKTILFYFLTHFEVRKSNKSPEKLLTYYKLQKSVWLKLFGLSQVVDEFSSIDDRFL